MQLWDSMCWPHVNLVPSGAVGKDCQRRLLSRPRFVRAVARRIIIIKAFWHLFFPLILRAGCVTQDGMVIQESVVVLSCTCTDWGQTRNTSSQPGLELCVFWVRVTRPVPKLIRLMTDFRHIILTLLVTVFCYRAIFVVAVLMLNCFGCGVETAVFPLPPPSPSIADYNTPILCCATQADM
jgi:hypothetical protein